MMILLSRQPPAAWRNRQRQLQRRGGSILDLEMAIPNLNALPRQAKFEIPWEKGRESRGEGRAKVTVAFWLVRLIRERGPSSLPVSLIDPIHLRFHHTCHPYHVLLFPFALPSAHSDRDTPQPTLDFSLFLPLFLLLPSLPSSPPSQPHAAILAFHLHLHPDQARAA